MRFALSRYRAFWWLAMCENYNSWIGVCKQNPSAVYREIRPLILAMRGMFGDALTLRKHFAEVGVVQSLEAFIG